MTKSSAKILIVDDDPAVRELVHDCLAGAGFEVTGLDRGKNVLDVVVRRQIDLAVVDLGLPDIDGLSLTRDLKSQTDVGIVILSGRGETTERIIGLEIGADDYLAKPFEPRELLARVRSVLRRLDGRSTARARAKGDTYEFEGWTLDPATAEVTQADGTLLDLSGSEYSLLQAFVEQPNRVLSRDALLNYTHEKAMPAFDRSIDVQVNRLRKKIEIDPKNPKLIKTMRNRGYMFTGKVSRR